METFLQNSAFFTKIVPFFRCFFYRLCHESIHKEIFLITYHPTTLEKNKSSYQVLNLISALDKFKKLFINLLIILINPIIKKIATKRGLRLFEINKEIDICIGTILDLYYQVEEKYSKIYIKSRRGRPVKK